MIIDFPAITVCNINKHRRSALTIEDIAVMGPHLGFTDENATLLHPELYPEDWYNDTFLNTNWQAVLTNTSGDQCFVNVFFSAIDYAAKFFDMINHVIM